MQRDGRGARAPGDRHRLHEEREAVTTPPGGDFFGTVRKAESGERDFDGSVGVARRLRQNHEPRLELTVAKALPPATADRRAPSAHFFEQARKIAGLRVARSFMFQDVFEPK